MNKPAVYLLLLSVLLTGLIGCEAKKPEKNKKAATPEKSRQQLEVITVEFTGRLRQALLAGIKNGGPAEAVNICADSAQILTRSAQKKEGVDIRRVSFRYRNSLNRPDAYEARILKRFGEMKSDGTLSDSTFIMEITEEKGQKILRFMKPIIMQPLCLNCHGDDRQVSAETAKLIKSHYPEDRARNFSPGDVRGAVSVKQLLN